MIIIEHCYAMIHKFDEIQQALKLLFTSVSTVLFLLQFKIYT